MRMYFILAKWLSVRLRTKWLWVRIPLQSLKNADLLFQSPKHCWQKKRLEENRQL